MDNRSQKFRILKKPRYIPLRFRLILMISGMLILLLGTLAVALGFIQSRTIRGQIEKRGLGVAQSLAAASMADLTIYNYVALERSANQAALNPDIEYVIIHDKEGRVAGYSGRPDLQNKFLMDDLSQKANAATAPLIQKRLFKSGKTDVLDVAAPVFLNETGDRWGTIRLGLSLAPMHKQIRLTQWIILAVGLMALAVGILVSTWAAKRVTYPLGNLVHATIEAAQGNLSQEISVKTGDEVEILASNFSTMIQEILDHRKQLEMQLVEIKRLHRHTEKLLTTMKDGLMSVDMDGRMATINPAVHEILEISDTRLKKGGSLSDVLAEDSELYSYIREILDSSIAGATVEVHFDLGETRKNILVGSSLLTDEAGEPQEIILNLHDITELKKLEFRVRQVERMAALGTMAAGLSHEIRNPLSAIKTFVQLLPRKLEKPGFLEKFQRTVPREINRINQLIEDLLDLARPPKYQFSKTNIRSLLKETIDFMEAELQTHNIRYVCKLSEDLPYIRADSAQLIKAFQNLIRNATQAMQTGGELTIEAYFEEEDPLSLSLAESRNGSVKVSFQDTGPGIPEEVLRNIFNPFFTTKDKGTGLGLAITHKVVTEHGGRIEATSDGRSGTRFTIGLPIQI